MVLNPPSLLLPMMTMTELTCNDSDGDVKVEKPSCEPAERKPRRCDHPSRHDGRTEAEPPAEGTRHWGLLYINKYNMS